MEDWRNLSLSQLKRLAKGRAGRVAELQMEIRIIEGIMDTKIKSGDFGETRQAETKKSEQRPEPNKEQTQQKEPENPQVNQQPPQQTQQTDQEPLIRPATQTPSQQSFQQTPEHEEKKHPDFDNKENGKPKSSNPHAFKEID